MASQPQTQKTLTESRARILDRLLRSHSRELLRQAHFHSRNHEDAEDALNDACVQFLRYYAGAAGRDALRWMLAVVKRCAWAIGRRNGVRDSRALAIDDALVFARGQLGPADLAERSEETTQAIGAIKQLKPDERTALILLGLGCSYAEIGELRSWSITKVRRCVYEGRTRVREQMERGGK